MTGTASGTMDLPRERADATLPCAVDGVSWHQVDAGLELGTGTVGPSGRACRCRAGSVETQETIGR